MIARPELVLVAVDDSMAQAWDELAAGRDHLRVHRGSVTELAVDAVVSPANSRGVMGGGIDGVYARWFPGIERRGQAATGGELPVGAAGIRAARPGPPRGVVNGPAKP